MKTFLIKTLEGFRISLQGGLSVALLFTPVLLLENPTLKNILLSAACLSTSLIIMNAQQLFPSLFHD